MSTASSRPVWRDTDDDRRELALEISGQDREPRRLMLELSGREHENACQAQMKS